MEDRAQFVHHSSYLYGKLPSAGGYIKTDRYGETRSRGVDMATRCYKTMATSPSSGLPPCLAISWSLHVRTWRRATQLGLLG